MKATIVIPNINGKGWLKDSIESVYAQTEQDFELIIVDNGSTDESLEQARSYCGRPNFTLIENGTNTGFTFDENFFAYFEDVDLSWRANNAGYKCVLCPTAKCYHICGASTGAVKYNAFKSQQSGRNSILLPLKNEPLLMLILNFLPLALGYLLKCYKFHKQGFGEAWDKGMHEAFALLKEGRLGKRPFRLKDLPNYILMELWMIWNMVPYLWYRLVVVRFDLK